MSEHNAELQVDLFINSADFPATDYDTVLDPGRLDTVVGRVAQGTAAEVDIAVTAAHAAFMSWRMVPAEERAALLTRAGEVLKAAIDDLAPLLVREHGGLLSEVRGDFMGGFANIAYYAGITPAFLEPEESSDERGWTSVEKRPRGVVAAIVPWNMPVVLTMMKLAPALATGNTIVVKPSPNAPLALTLLLKRMASVFPPGVINVVHGGADVGAALTVHPLVKKVAFTGGCATGREVMRNAAESFKGVTLELGGNDPAIVLDDVDLDAAMPRLIKGIFTRSGQICYAIKRLYVPESIFDSFYDRLCAEVDKLAVGHGLDERSSFGPLNNERQHLFVLELIDRARAEGASVRQLGSKVDPGNWDNGYYVLPHVVIDRDHTTRLVGCEQFGPVIPLTPYRDVDEAVRWANTTEYGLASSVWSTDHDRALAVARKIEAGLTFINTHGLGSTVFGMPFGGIKNSGVGREMSAEPTLSAYTDYHAIRHLY